MCWHTHIHSEHIFKCREYAISRSIPFRWARPVGKVISAHLRRVICFFAVYDLHVSALCCVFMNELNLLGDAYDYLTHIESELYNCWFICYELYRKSRHHTIITTLHVLYTIVILLSNFRANDGCTLIIHFAYTKCTDDYLYCTSIQYICVSAELWSACKSTIRFLSWFDFVITWTHKVKVSIAKRIHMWSTSILLEIKYSV